MSTSSLGFGRSLWLLCGGLLVWALYFLVAGAVTGLACARGFMHTVWLGLSVMPVLLLLLAAAALGVLLTIARSADRLLDGTARRSDDTRRVVAQVATAVCGLALVAIVWTALPLVLAPLRC